MPQLPHWRDGLAAAPSRAASGRTSSRPAA